MPGTSGHIHVSIRDKSGRNIFAVTEEEKKAGGREGAAFDDTKYLSQEAEWFLAGLLEGLSDGMSPVHFSLIPFSFSKHLLLAGSAYTSHHLRHCSI